MVELHGGDGTAAGTTADASTAGQLITCCTVLLEAAARSAAMETRHCLT